MDNNLFQTGVLTHDATAFTTGFNNNLQKGNILSVINDKYFSLVSTEPKAGGGFKVIGQCLLCPPAKGKGQNSNQKMKIIVGDSNTEANFTKHLRRLHAAEFDEYTDWKSKKAKVVSENPKEKQSTLSHFRTGITLGKQKRVDNLLIKFIVKGMKPLSTVDEDAFRELISTLSEVDPVHIMSRRTLFTRICDLKNSTMEVLKSKLSSVDYICLTADAWTGSYRSFLGVTAHWISDKFLRESAVLACTRFKGSHTYNKIADELNKVMNRFGIKQKVTCIVTDNGANFVKAFKEYSLDFDELAKEQCEADSNNDSEEEEDNGNELAKNVQLGEMLDQRNQSHVMLSLPPHIRCASHTINLIAGKDINNVTDKGLYYKALGKCTKMWNLGTSPSSAEKIKTIYGKILKRPGATRWNGIHDSLKCILSVESHLNEIASELNIAALTERELEFVKEYVLVTEPLAYALDLLQGEKGMFIGALLPTLFKLQEWLLSLREERKFCGKFLDVFLESLSRRFEEVLKIEDDPSDLVLAAISHPFCKLRWLPENIQEKMKTKFIQECLKFAENFITSSNDADVRMESSRNLAIVTNPLLDFPSGNQIDYGSASMNDVEMECRNYLNDPDLSINMLEKYPNVRNFFSRYNTGVPSSAPVERLFSYAGLIMTKRRCSLSDDMFETLVFLKYNWLFQSDCLY